MIKSASVLHVAQPPNHQYIKSYLVGILVPIMLVLLLTGTSLQAEAQTTAVNMNCTLIVPNDPLTAQGLATPYFLKATDPAYGRCHEKNPLQSAFVQAAVVNPGGSIGIYNPLVIDKGTQPAIKPVVPVIASGSVVGIWFGFNDQVLMLQGEQDNPLAKNKCVQGIPDSPFGQFAYCNAVDFFTAANRAIQAGNLVPPSLGSDRRGLTCPTTRSFFIVDQDQSDNVTTAYLKMPDGKLAQDTAANRQVLPDAMALTNASDNLLLVEADKALGCTPWMEPDLADPGHLTTALPLNELQAATQQASPAALVPAKDPMVLVAQNNTFATNLKKLNRYRDGVDQPEAQALQDTSTKTYCDNLQQTVPSRLSSDASLLGQAPTPDAAVGNTLFTFMAQRYLNTFINPLGIGLNCMKQFGLQPFVATVQNEQGVAVAVRITVNGKKQSFNAHGTASPIKKHKGKGH